jgi:hypothetical protein
MPTRWYTFANHQLRDLLKRSRQKTAIEFDLKEIPEDSAVKSGRMTEIFFVPIRRLEPTFKVTSDCRGKKEEKQGPVLFSSPRNVQHEQTKRKGKDWGRPTLPKGGTVHDSHVRFIRRLQRLSVQMNFNIPDEEEKKG